MEDNSVGISDTPKKVPFKLLKNITNNFAPDRKLGSGAYGDVYKGVPEDGGRVIAIKKLRFMPLNDDNQFENEFIHLSRLNHPNIVKLVGFCDETEEVCVPYKGQMVHAVQIHRALCLEFMPNGGLSKFISEKHLGLNWHIRFKIIQGICEGLKYLHDVSTMHFDLKPDNILLDDKMVPKIADFGLSRLLGAENTIMTKTPLGTIGFLPPEFINKQVISKEYDIFSLGVIIKRIVTGIMDYLCISSLDDLECIEHVHDNWRKRLHEIPLYPSLDVDCKQVRTCIEIAVVCMSEDRHKRPTMNDIVRRLRKVQIKEKDSRLKAEQFIPGKSILPMKKLYPEVPDIALSGEGEGSFINGDLSGNKFLRRPVQLPFKLLQEITNDFAEEHILAESSFGTVFLGTFDSGEIIAVQRLKQYFRITHTELFRDAVSALMEIKHENIVQLVGFCHEKTKPVKEYDGKYFLMDNIESLLCYEYVPRGSLDKYIYGESRPIDWNWRFKVIMGICDGLYFLHKVLDRPIDHVNLDLKNIWLDHNMVPKLLDVALSILLDGLNFQKEFSEIRYPAKSTEEHAGAKLGVLIMEIATGEKNGRQCFSFDKTVVHPSISKDVGSVRQKITKYFYPQKRKEKQKKENNSQCAKKFVDTVHANSIDELKDEYIASKYKLLDVNCIHQLKLCIQIGLRCAEIDMNKRPSIQEIVEELNNTTSGSRLNEQDMTPSFTTWRFPIISRVYRELSAESSGGRRIKWKVAAAPKKGKRKGIQCTSNKLDQIIVDENYRQVLSIDMHPKEPWILTSNHRGTVCIWNYQKPATMNSFEVSIEEPVYSAKFIEQGHSLVSGDGNGYIHIYSYDTMEEVRNFKAHDKRIMSLAVNPAFSLVLSASDDRLIKLWDWNKDWECVRIFEGHYNSVTQVMFHPKDSIQFASASLDRSVKIWNSFSGECNITLDGHSDGLLCLHYFTDKQIRYFRQFIICGSSDGAAKVWNPETQSCVDTLDGHVNRLNAVCWHPELDGLVTGSIDGAIQIWKLMTTTYRLQNTTDFNLGAVNALGYIKELRRIVVACDQGIALVKINSSDSDDDSDDEY